MHLKGRLPWSPVREVYMPQECTQPIRTWWLKQEATATAACRPCEILGPTRELSDILRLIASRVAVPMTELR
jgi:hypothetical protein